MVYLGVSAAVPAYGRGLPSIAVMYRGLVYLFDVGEGTQERLVEAGLSPLRVKVVAVTHMHGDHFLGLAGLLQSMTMGGRREELFVIGPRGLLEYIEIVERLTGHVRSFDIVFREVEEGVVYEDNRVVIKAFRVCHGHVAAYGYVFEEKPRPGRVKLEKLKELGLKPGPYLSRVKRGESVIVNGVLVRPEDVLEEPRPGVRVVYTGDTRPCKTVIDVARGADLLIHESTFLESEASEAHEKGHSTALEAGLVAAKAGVKCLALTHFSARYRELDVFETEARRNFGNCVYAARPLLIHPLRL